MAVKKTKRLTWAVAVIGFLLVGVVSVFAFSFGKYEKVKVNGALATIPLSRVADGAAHFYKFEDGGKEITFFAIKAADGSYRTAFNACDSCFRAKKGYEQKGSAMICQNCNRKFAISRLGPNETGGCNPGYLPNQLSGTNITIKVADLKAGARYF